MSDESPAAPPGPPLPEPGPTPAERAVALLEVLICSDYPTQLALGATLYALGFHDRVQDGSLSIGFVTTVSLLDAALLVGLIVLFLRARGEHPLEVFFDHRPILPELRLSVALTIGAFAIAIFVLVAVRTLAPSLHPDHNPLEDVMRTPAQAILFSVVVIVAGGVREELQRAFLLRRFEQSLGGGAVGVIVTSVAFGLGHKVQGVDAMIATGTLGAFWGIVYLRRRSVVAPMVSHAAFDLLQIAQFLTFGR